MSENVRTITITEDKSGVFIATSDDDPPMFCAATSLGRIVESIERVLNIAASPPTQAPFDISAIERRSEQIDSELPELMYSWLHKRS